MQFTFTDFVLGICDWKQYYGQFVTQSIADRVLDRFGLPLLEDAFMSDGSFDGIPMGDWNSIDITKEVAQELERAGDCFVFDVDNHRIVMEAARQLVHIELYGFDRGGFLTLTSQYRNSDG